MKLMKFKISQIPGVYVDYLSKSKTQHCGECICLITPDGERTMSTYLGASQEMEEEDLVQEVKIKTFLLIFISISLELKFYILKDIKFIFQN